MEKRYLPLEDAVREAAKQNFLCDRKKGLVSLREWQEQKAIYEAEARAILLETGENYLPENGEAHIVVE